MLERERPDPDALLKQVQAERPEAMGKGRLKVYLGMAAGVGKTYSMLSDAQEEKKRGVDVVIGYLEPHGREDTEAMAEGLESVPLKEIEHQNVTLKEFDIDAAIARKPDLLLLDELAHTNAPGSRHKKRWQDAEELVRAGIDVNATVNIQHLESLNDVVAQITGIRVAETLPDWIVAEANEVELVDIPPDELIQRIREGKVYIPEKVEQALDGFFKKKHLAALRELALRKTAESVDREVLTYRAVEGAREPWRTVERILVCVAPNRMAARAVRAARRMADALHGELIAVTVESARQAKVGDEGRQLAYDALRLAENLGAQTTVLSGDDIVKTLMEYAREKNVTTLIVGKPVRPKWKELLYGSVVDAIVRASGDIDVHVITGPEEAGTPLRLMHGESDQHDWKAYGAAVAVTALSTFVSVVLSQAFSIANLVMVYLAGVAYVAAKFGRNAAILASLFGVAAFDFCFVPPRWTFAVSDVQYLVTFGVMLAVALLIGTLTARLRDQSLAAKQREKITGALYELSRKLSSTRSRRQLGAFAAGEVRDVFGCDVAVLIRSRKTGELFAAPASRTSFEALPKEQAVATWVAEHGKRAGRGTDTLPSSEGLYVPLSGERGPVGVLAVRIEDGDWDLAKLHLLETFANQLAVAVERTNLAKDSHEATIETERERLRSTLLSSVSHDFRTPLSVVVAAAEQLRGRLNSGPDKELADAIAEEASRLERQVRNLLDMTRLRYGAVQVKKEWQSLEELVGSALSRTEAVLADRTVHVDLAEDQPLLELDGVMMEQVFVNLLENAANHTPPKTNVWISSLQGPGGPVVEIANDGPSLPLKELETIFEQFSQGTEARGGTGLGLAICRAIVEAHGGTIHAETRSPQGVRFIIELPVSHRAPEVPVG